ncbi:hypothetical protein MSG28_002743 [Choristoneura fumiferana]|uniref:Uncharacterized protein n=1 Tax=Choristoneura fumiferana TaxID=7141 RepID=A0ACC0JJ79_CHOFU|nr:hypothetical protein MSG28_002743 [Choristoneura fumiferana]
MADKLHEYQGFTGRLHGARDRCKERWSQWKEQHPRGVKETFKDSLFGIPNSDDPPERVWQESEYSDIFRRKSRIELMRISAAVMGIEFSYAGETAFVSPTLLQIGVPHHQMTLVWALSPLVGFFMTPLLGSISDRCRSRFGRRRPFIVMMSLGVLLGLILVPNGEAIGYALGDERPANLTEVPSVLGPRSSALETADSNSHPWGVLFTVLGTVFLDFDADACQSPARAYLLDVTVPEDHAKGLSTFTIMAGLGGFMGYALGGINWDETRLGELFGGHVRAVFSLITVIFVACVSATVTSFKEIPLGELQGQEEFRKLAETERIQESFDAGDEQPARNCLKRDNTTYGIVCLTNLFCWMAHVCYSLYFTDFVGESVFGGNPAAPVGSESRIDYEAGVRFGCWGMAMAKRVYVGGLCTYSCGMFLLCVIRARAAVLLFSWTAGVMYSTLFTMPYLLVAHYHATGMWNSEGGGCSEERGLGTDVAVVSSCVFVAQLLVSVLMGLAVKASGSTAAVVAVAAALAAAAAISATKITYLDL